VVPPLDHQPQQRMAHFLFACAARWIQFVSLLATGRHAHRCRGYPVKPLASACVVGVVLDFTKRFRHFARPVQRLRHELAAWMDRDRVAPPKKIE
jgi:hypothetical protein